MKTWCSGTDTPGQRRLTGIEAAILPFFRIIFCKKSKVQSGILKFYPTSIWNRYSLPKRPSLTTNEVIFDGKCALFSPLMFNVYDWISDCGTSAGFSHWRWTKSGVVFLGGKTSSIYHSCFFVCLTSPEVLELDRVISFEFVLVHLSLRLVSTRQWYRHEFHTNVQLEFCPK